MATPAATAVTTANRQRDGVEDWAAATGVNPRAPTTRDDGSLLVYFGHFGVSFGRFGVQHSGDGVVRPSDDWRNDEISS